MQKQKHMLKNISALQGSPANSYSSSQLAWHFIQSFGLTALTDSHITLL